MTKISEMSNSKGENSFKYVEMKYESLTNEFYTLLVYF